MINLTIDGIQVQVEDGTTILQAAQAAGIDIPTLCYMKELAPDGSCRMCLVEVEGARGLMTACAAPVTEGMVVRTNTPEVLESRKFILQMMLSNHTGDCMSCAANGKCKLQQYAMDYEVERGDFEGETCQIPPDDSSPFFIYDPGKCILCRRCVRTCQEIQCNGTIAATERGFETTVSPVMGIKIADSNCVSCGNCVQACPTGALSLKAGKKFRDWETKKVLTTCPHCATGCQF